MFTFPDAFDVCFQTTWAWTIVDSPATRADWFSYSVLPFCALIVFLFLKLWRPLPPVQHCVIAPGPPTTSWQILVYVIPPSVSISCDCTLATVALSAIAVLLVVIAALLTVRFGLLSFSPAIPLFFVCALPRPWFVRLSATAPSAIAAWFTIIFISIRFRFTCMPVPLRHLSMHSASLILMLIFLRLASMLAIFPPSPCVRLICLIRAAPSTP